MPATYVRRFGDLSREGETGGLRAWRWNGSEDIELADYCGDLVSSHAYQNTLGDFHVDRSGPAPVLRWQWYQLDSSTDWERVPTGTYGELPLMTGDYIDALGYESPTWPDEGDNPYGGEIIAKWDMVGRWESDQYGRPYDLNDLLAPGTAP